MNVLSLFDGMSCGQIALNRLGIKYDNYYASEIDKWAIQITQKNYPDTIQLGDVRVIEAKNLPKIDLLMAGSPCQGFSFAGKQLNFDDPRSKLFFDFVRLLKECNPKYFLLENVKMKKEYIKTISDTLRVDPIEINSSLVSAQNRRRLYWTNIPCLTRPHDKKITLSDIIEKEPSSVTYLSKKTAERFNEYGTPILDGTEDKARCLSAMEYVKNGKQGNYIDTHLLLRARGNKPGGIRGEDGKSGSLTSSAFEQNNFIYDPDKPNQINPAKEAGKRQPYMQNRVFHTDGKSHCLTASFSSRTNIGKDMSSYRKLTPVECERLQTVPDNYTEGVSNTQRYKMLGNGWTVDVIVHILKGAEW